MGVMKVLVSDNLGEAGIELFRKEKGIEVDIKTDLSPEELVGIIKGYHALVIRSATRVTEELLAAAENLKVIGRAGIGVDKCADLGYERSVGRTVLQKPAVGREDENVAGVGQVNSCGQHGRIQRCTFVVLCQGPELEEIALVASCSVYRSKRCDCAGIGEQHATCNIVGVVSPSSEVGPATVNGECIDSRVQCAGLSDQCG